MSPTPASWDVVTVQGQLVWDVPVVSRPCDVAVSAADILLDVASVRSCPSPTHHRNDTFLQTVGNPADDRLANVGWSPADQALSFFHMFATPQNVASGLREAGYATDPVLVQIIWLATKMQKPILIEGPPGTGKTYLAQAFAAAAKTDLIRLQCFEGITEKQAIGSFDEALQRLFLETQAETLDRQWEKLRLQLHTLDFFTQGPLFQAVLQPKPVVLLIDELDKVDQKFEALLLEILSDWQITVPKLGTVKAKTIPFVVMTSNQERRLGDPLRRRSLYQRIEHPDVKKEAEILDIRTVEAPLELKAQAVGLAQALRGYNLVKPPSIDEIVQFVRALQLLGRSEIRPEDRDVLLPFLAKTEEDVKRLLLRDGFSSLVATAHEYRDQALAAMRGGTEKLLEAPV